MKYITVYVYCLFFFIVVLFKESRDTTKTADLTPLLTLNATVLCTDNKHNLREAAVTFKFA